jgi:hypothetical protein
MASFTDSIPQFNPYVQQLPVEAMVQVGMYKQKQYDEGIQKIQTSIDNIAGLEVSRDVDKAYLQSKLNQLGSDLRTVAAGDFSNFQLVNSVNGMTNQIVRDPNVQNAVSSSAKRKKEMQLMEEARKKGELNPSNEYVFKVKDSAWMDSTELGQSYNAQYTPYFDTEKHIRESFKGLEKDGVSVDQIFQTDANGKIMMSNGQPVLSPYMKRLKKEGMFPEKVKATIEQAFSDGRVSQQLSIDGQYTYRGYQQETLAQKVLEDKDKIMTQYENELLDLNLKKSFGANVNDQIDEMVEKMKGIDKSYNDLYNSAFDNPDAVRGMIYKDDVKRRWTSMYSNIVQTEEVVDSPAYKMRFEEEKELQRRREKAFDQKLDVQKFERDEYWKKKNYDLDVQKAINEANKTKPGKGGGVTGTGYGDPTRGIENPYATDKDNQAIILAENKYNTAADSYNYNRDEFIWKTIYNTGKNADENNAKAQKIVDEGRANGKDITIQQARSIMIDRAAARDKQNKYDFRRKWFNVAEKRVNDPKNTLNSDKSVMNLYTSTMKTKKLWENEKSLKDERDKVELNTLDRIGASEEFKNLKDETIDYRGQKVKITKQDQIDIAAYIAGKESVFYGLDSSDVEIQSANLAKRRLDKKGLGDIAERFLQRKRKNSPNPVSSIVGGFSEMGSNVGDLFGGTFSDNGLENTITNLIGSIREKEYTKAYASKASVARAQYNIAPNKTFNLMSDDKGINDLLRSDLGTIASTFQTGGKNQNLASDDEFESFIADIKDEDATFTITSEVDEAGNPVTAVVSIDKDGKPSGRMVLNPDQSTKLGYDVNMMFETNEVTAMKSIMNSRGGKTCFGEPYDIDTYSVGDNAYYDLHAGDFPNVKNKNITVKGNVLEQDGLYFGYIYVNNGNSEPKVKSLPPSDNLSTLNTAMQTVVNDQFIQSILKE